MVSRIAWLNGTLLSLGLAITQPGCSRDPPVAQTPPLEVVVSQPVKEKIEDWDTYTGLVEAKESVDIRARVRGHIKEVKFKDGAEVKEGAVLFLLDDGPFKAQEEQAKGQLKVQQAKLKLAEERIGILEPLVKTGSAAKQELDKALADKGEANGSIATAKAQIQEAKLNIDYCRITAPISGKTSRALLTKGNLVNATTENLLTTLVSVDPMYVYFHVNERALQRYREEAVKQARRDRAGLDKAKVKDKGHPQDADIKVQMALINDRGFPRHGVIDFIDNRIDPSTGTIKVRARFKNDKQEGGQRPLVAGLFARVRVVVSDKYDAILVADRALLTDQSLKYVMVVNKEKSNLVERVDVAPGRLQEDGLRVIENGLKGNEWVIVDGVTLVRPGLLVAPQEGAMPRRPGLRPAAPIVQKLPNGNLWDGLQTKD